MLKKVSLMVVALLAMASLANAALLYQVDGTNYAAGSVIPVAGSSVVISVYNTETIATGYEIGGVVSTGIGSSITNPVATDNLPGGAANWTFDESYGWQTAYDGTNDGFVIAISSGVSVAPTLQGVLFSFTVNDIGSSTDFAVIDGSWNPNTFGSVTLTPEPATMALLGLGAILLRKRK